MKSARDPKTRPAPGVRSHAPSLVRPSRADAVPPLLVSPLPFDPSRRDAVKDAQCRASEAPRAIIPRAVGDWLFCLGFATLYF